MRRHQRSYLAFAADLAISVVACGPESDARQPTRAGAVDSLPDDSGTDAQTFLGLMQPERGFRVRSIGAEIAAGQDVEYCEVARLPGTADDIYYSNAFELANAANSHHLIVSAAVPGGAAAAKLEALGVHERVECLGARQQFGDSGFEGVAGSQQPYLKLTYPAGVGRRYRGGQLIVFDYHYLNPGERPVIARSAVNFHLTDAQSIKYLAHGFAFRNHTIDTPAGARGTFTSECHFRADVMVGALTRHTHRWGTEFSVWFAGGPRSGERIWTTHDWQHDVDYRFDPPALLRAGEGLRFRCDFENTTDRALRYGSSANDEMCILFGTMWQAHDGQSLESQDCSIVWIDAAGIGHSAQESGGFPAPSAAQVEACLARADGADACRRCRCEACAAPAIKCRTDADCSAVLDCYKGCAGARDCTTRCQSVIDAHSSSVGMFSQMLGCFEGKCSSVCASSGP